MITSTPVAFLMTLFASASVHAAQPVPSSQPAPPAQIGVASFNLAWAGSQQDFDRHAAVCTAVNWCDTRPKREKGQSRPTDEAVQAARQCVADTTRLAGGPEKASMMVPCNAYLGRDNAAPPTSADYAAKLAGLQATIADLIEKGGVKVIAFQEVRSAEVIKTLLGKHADRFGTCDAPHDGFQTTAFAWDKSMGETGAKCSVNEDLAVSDNPGAKDAHKVRPGLTLELEWADRRLSFLNVHLKSSCANIVPTPIYQARLLDDPNPACQVLNRQVAPIERWLDSVAQRSPDFVLLGDFNRRIDEEAAANIRPGQVRTDGSNPAGVPPQDANGKVATRYLWQELNDGTRALKQVPLTNVDTGCRGFTGLDHIVLSGALAARQAPEIGSRKTAVVQQPGQRIDTSDHCPRSVTLNF
ncbi:endonuclease/exonuclease/phosphatase family protein [Massilia sp. YIM B02769]|uniref:endonuclease/exonuclease/phosphatase family protein n=1 Tax=Massilia sp. YIM B02769 TaxID=3050129 RepID=UPI0025B6D2F1|nr:endonuclease/exonuclease/phosphatase family protein [Massilia sp. YIM B02769]MDN4058242.1 endonuclease/exonuclease/phosphatase family protein [Massilia sp. YIM B02769]